MSILKIEFYMEAIVCNISFVISKLKFLNDILAIWHFGILAIWQFWHFGILTFWQFGILAIWHFGILAFWPFGVLAIWHFGNLAFWHFQYRPLSSEHSTINTPFWALLTSIYAIQDLSLGQDLFIVISISQWP